MTADHDGSDCGRPSLLNQATPRPRLRDDAASTAIVHHITARSHSGMQDLWCEISASPESGKPTTTRAIAARYTAGH
jgi:hypothetical protein